MDGPARQDYYRMEPRTVITELRTGKNGLSTAEAAERLEQLGSNRLQRVRRDSGLVIFIRQFKNLLVIILLASASLSLYLHDVRTATILTLIALMNAVIGFFQEHKAETLMDSLERLVVPKAKVIRGSQLTEVDSTELVPGDVIYIEEGDSVPADVRLLDEDELTTNDFALSGESNPTRKFVHAIEAAVPLGNRHNLLFMGTTVATGHGHGVVVGTGMSTELGRIANLSQSAHSGASPLQKEMNHLATRLVQATFVLAAVLTVIALRIPLSVHDSLLFAIGIAAAMIPNGLVAEVNVTLAQTAGRMAKARALVKKLSAVETLGATNIIATDKTGTLTKNEMTVEQMLIGKTLYKTSGTGYEPSGSIIGSRNRPLQELALKDLELFFATGSLASNAHLSPPDAEHQSWYCVGDPTEGALIALTKKAGLDPVALSDKNKELKEFAFDSARKRMSSLRRYGDQLIVFVKGAPESLLERSAELWDHSHIRPLHPEDRAYFTAYNEKMARAAMRNLAFAYRVLPADTKVHQLKIEDVEQDLTFLGIVSMVDPLREQVPAAMAAARAAHIKVSIVTGDYPTTAKAIAVRAGLAASASDVRVVLGEELEHLPDAQIVRLITHGGAVFSRVAPEDKLRIVELAKSSGKVVAVTGDGINDAPALKRADIGVAMGRTGTDVAKDAAEIILLDDSFGTLVGAIEQGRLTYQNIKKAARCALTDNAGELLTILMSLAGQALFNIPMAITAIQILAVDIIAQMFPITALGWDEAQRNLMHDQPRKLTDHIINRHSVTEFFAFGLLSASLAYANFLFFFMRHGTSAIRLSTDSPLYFKATILTYLTIVLCQFVNLMLVRSSEHERLFTRYLWSNKKLLIAFAISFFCILNILYNPAVQPYFHAGPLGLNDWLSAVGAAAVYLSVRIFQRHTRKHTRKAVLQLHRQKLHVSSTVS